MTETPKGHEYFGSDESRFATMQDEQRLGGESSPPGLTTETGTPRYAKGHAPSQQEMSTHHLTDEERELRANSANTYQGSRGTPGAPLPTEDDAV
jgi:hypothetical protein